MCKNNLRGIITLGIGPLWVIHPLILIFSWSIIIQQIRVSKNQFLSSTFGSKRLYKDDWASSDSCPVRCPEVGGWVTSDDQLVLPPLVMNTTHGDESGKADLLRFNVLRIPSMPALRFVEVKRSWDACSTETTLLVKGTDIAESLICFWYPDTSTTDF